MRNSRRAADPRGPDRKGPDPQHRRRPVCHRRFQSAAASYGFFNHGEKLGIYEQFYNFAGRRETKKPNGSIEYSVTKDGTNEKIFDYTEDIASLPGASAQQVTVEKLLQLDKLPPGQYKLQLKVTDKTRNQVLTPVASFTVT